jgi:hypothetical protein
MNIFENLNQYIMKHKSQFLIVLFLTCLSINPLVSVKCQYTTNAMISKKISSLANQYQAYCVVKSLVRTSAGNDLWVLTIGTGDRDNKPGIAIVGGVDSKYLFSRDLASGFAETLLKNSAEDEIKTLLNKVTFYVFPDVNPDASAQASAALKYERNINSTPIDNDRDFVIDEDPFEDLNGDGIITLIRIADPSGIFTESPEDKRLMVTAEITEGQTGNYQVFSEGIDNDKDSYFNEDGSGGVNFNNNFTYNYEEFGRYSGPYPMSEQESRAVADYLFDRFNIFAVITFGPQDNLGQPMKSQERQTPNQGSENDQFPNQRMRRQRGKINSILKSDELVNKVVSDKYHEITGLKGAPAALSEPGNFMEWAYFHYGRYSFGTPGWWIQTEKGKNSEAAFLKFADKEGLNDVFVPWTRIDHPDFPGKITEVGGIKPYVLFIPPPDSIDYLISSHYKFITAVAAMHPELEILDIKVEDAGENIFRLSLKIHNKGLLATCTELGDEYIWTRIMRLTAETSTGQELISGLRTQRINRLQGDESAEFKWLISGKGKVVISAGSANTGEVSTTIELK